LFGGFCVTGTIARTATNIRAGAHGPVAGVLHALFVLVAFLTLMPIAAHIPFAALAGVLLLVAWGMVERHELALTWRGPRGGVVALMVTLLVVALVDLMAGIVAGTLVWLLARRLEASRPKRPATPD
jgi:SulP family sulfate permease